MVKKKNRKKAVPHRLLLCWLAMLNLDALVVKKSMSAELVSSRSESNRRESGRAKGATVARGWNDEA